MTAEQLLIPRYRLIADYIGSDFSVGQVISAEDYPYFQDFDYERYKANFQKMEWWEERQEKDMPKKIKFKSLREDRYHLMEVDKWGFCSSRVYPIRIAVSGHRKIYLSSDIVSYPVD